MTIGQRIKNRRLELGLSIDLVATKLNKNRATIYRYESNDIENLPTTVLEPLSEILQTTPAFLMGWEDDPGEIVDDETKDLFRDTQVCAIARAYKNASPDNKKLLRLLIKSMAEEAEKDAEKDN